MDAEQLRIRERQRLELRAKLPDHGLALLRHTAAAKLRELAETDVVNAQDIAPAGDLQRGDRAAPGVDGEIDRAAAAPLFRNAYAQLYEPAAL